MQRKYEFLLLKTSRYLYIYRDMTINQQLDYIMCETWKEYLYT